MCVLTVKGFNRTIFLGSKQVIFPKKLCISLLLCHFKSKMTVNHETAQV